MRWLARIPLRLTTLVLLALATGCTPEPATPLRLGTNLWTGYEPLYLAQARGYFADAPIRLVEYTSATQVIHGFRNGTIDAAALTLDEVLLLIQDGHQPCLILVMDISHGADAILGRAGVQRLADLRGRRVGVESTAVGSYLLARALQTARLPRSALQIVPLEFDEHERAFREGRVDAIVTFEPVRSKLLAAGAHILFDSRQIPGEIMDVLVMRREYLQQHPAAARQLVAGWFRALDAMQQAPQETAAHMATRLGIRADNYLAALKLLHLPDREENRRLLGGDTPAALTAANRLADTMLDQHLLRTRPDLQHLPDARFLPVRE